MAYKVYIDGELTNGKWVILEAIPRGKGNVFTARTEADKQAAKELKNWQRIKRQSSRTIQSGKSRKAYRIRSRVVKVKG